MIALPEEAAARRVFDYGQTREEDGPAMVQVVEYHLLVNGELARLTPDTATGWTVWAETPSRTYAFDVAELPA